MEVLLKYRGRSIGEPELATIRGVIAEHPAASRRRLSEELCRVWNWVQPNGAPCGMICRGLMLALDRAGHITLPPARSRPVNQLVARRRLESPKVDTTPVECGLRQLGPLEIRMVRRTAEERVVNGLLEHHHYLGYTQPVGENLKYGVYAGGRMVACLTWSSAARHLGPRDRFIGWSREARRRNIRFIAYNSRYLILPWVRVPHLASHILGQMVRRVPRDWEHLYGHPIHYLETFIDPQRSRGTCYRAANWTMLGLTTGRGKADNSNRPNRSLKQVLAYPLDKRFRDLLETL